jgi:hypothetical protein
MQEIGGWAGAMVLLAIPDARHLAARAVAGARVIRHRAPMLGSIAEGCACARARVRDGSGFFQ